MPLVIYKSQAVKRLNCFPFNFLYHPIFALVLSEAFSFLFLSSDNRVSTQIEENISRTFTVGYQGGVFMQRKGSRILKLRSIEKMDGRGGVC